MQQRLARATLVVMRVVILFPLVVFAFLAGCGSGDTDATLRDRSLQRRSDLPAPHEASQGSEKGAQSVGREPHSRGGTGKGGK